MSLTRPSTRITRSFFAGLFTAPAFLAGCATPRAASTGEPVYEEGAVIHNVSDADRQFARSTEPVGTPSATLWVNGLGCPQCASNIDLQLERVSGVESIYTDLSVGKVTVGFSAGAKHPSPADLSEAVEDAGFTLVKVEPGLAKSTPSSR